jgi:hypothetical protein
MLSHGPVCRRARRHPTGKSAFAFGEFGENCIYHGEQISVDYQLSNTNQAPLRVLDPLETKVQIRQKSLETKLWRLEGTRRIPVKHMRHRNNISIEIPDRPRATLLQPNASIPGSYDLLPTAWDLESLGFEGCSDFHPWSFRIGAASEFLSELPPGEYAMKLVYTTAHALELGTSDDFQTGMRELWQGTVESKELRFRIKTQRNKTFRKAIGIDRPDTA